ncbi:MAG: DUF4349 domain-containing protein [Chloroflexota bacterium]
MSATIRLPRENFVSVLDQRENGAIEVQHKNITGRDITLEYTDLESRLGNLENTAEQLRLIMAEAKKTEDVLAVYNQLTYVTEQAEVIRGQLNYYSESASFSAISINLVAEATLAPVTIGGWEPVGIARDAVQSLVNALQGITNVLIWIALFLLPIGLIIFLPVIIALRVWKKRKAKVVVTAAAD